MQTHLSICAAKEGITYSFDNNQIIDYQDNYKYMGDLPFSVYFGFETTTGNAVFFDSKMFLMSYCLIFSFNNALNFEKIVILKVFNNQLPKFTISAILNKSMFSYLIKLLLDN